MNKQGLLKVGEGDRNGLEYNDDDLIISPSKMLFQNSNEFSQGGGYDYQNEMGG